MEFSAAEIAGLIGGSIEGNADIKVSALAKIEEAKQGSIAFLSNPKYVSYLSTSGASIVIIDDEIKTDKPDSITFIRVKNARNAFSLLLEAYYERLTKKTGIETPSSISKSATLGSNIYVGAFAVIGDNCRIGDNVKIYPGVNIGDSCTIGNATTLFPGVKVYLGSVIGKNCTIHAGAVIGSDGFGFVPNQENNYRKIHHIGNVIIEDNVEIGSNTTIDRATIGSTILRKGVKLDNLIQIGHNVEIGENTVIAAQAGVAGSSKIGSDCMIGGQVGIIGHINIGNRVKIAAQSGVGSDVPDDSAIQGTPSFDHFKFKKSYVVFKNLPEIVKKIK
jgi:UDP-3-O-[3-hydroxymyristoyl] glucosamine N-acyltransferase